MARPRKQASRSGGTGSAGGAGGSSEISSGQASYVLNRLLGERRITRADVAHYLSEMGREIHELERRLNELREAHGGKIAAAAGALAAAGAAVVVARRRGRPPGSGKKAAAADAAPATTTTGKRRGRPPGSGKKRRGRPPGSGKKSAEGATTSTGTSAPSGGAKRRGRPSKGTASLSAGQLASRQLQGRYLALVRQFPEARRAQFARTAKEKGRETAIQEMQDALKK